MTELDQIQLGKTLWNLAGQLRGAMNADDFREDCGPAEQQRIAACLSSLDGMLSAASRKVEALKQHKKALMQQLFPAAEGEGA